MTEIIEFIDLFRKKTWQNYELPSTIILKQQITCEKFPTINEILFKQIYTDTCSFVEKTYSNMNDVLYDTPTTISIATIYTTEKKKLKNKKKTPDI